MKYLIETALMTHGLRSVSDEELTGLWPFREKNIVWLEKGKVRIGGIEDFLPFRDRNAEIKRVSADSLAFFEENGMDGACTASATMLIASRMGIGAAVTSGMGGIGNIKGEELCPDLPAVRDLPVVLFSTGPKDVVDIGATLEWFRREGVPVYGKTSPSYSGFMAIGRCFELDGTWENGTPKAPCLMLNPIEEADRLDIPGIVERAVAAGHAASERGGAFHPAANAVFDSESCGKSSRLQLRQLINNALWAEEIM